MGFRSARCTFALKVSSIIHRNVRITEQAAAALLRRQNTIRDAHREMLNNLHPFAGVTSPPKHKRMESLRGCLSGFQSCTQLHLHTKVETRKSSSALFCPLLCKRCELLKTSRLSRVRSHWFPHEHTSQEKVYHHRFQLLEMLPLLEITLVDHMKEIERKRGTMKWERGKEDGKKELKTVKDIKRGQEYGWIPGRTENKKDSCISHLPPSTVGGLSQALGLSLCHF